MPQTNPTPSRGLFRADSIRGTLRFAMSAALSRGRVAHHTTSSPTGVSCLRIEASCLGSQVSLHRLSPGHALCGMNRIYVDAASQRSRSFSWKPNIDHWPPAALNLKVQRHQRMHGVYFRPGNVLDQSGGGTENELGKACRNLGSVNWLKRSACRNGNSRPPRHRGHDRYQQLMKLRGSEDRPWQSR